MTDHVIFYFDDQHPEYGFGPGSFPNDISVIVLAEDADLNNPLIETIAMANTGDNDEGKRGTILGWGYTTPGGSKFYYC